MPEAGQQQERKIYFGMMRTAYMGKAYQQDIFTVGEITWSEFEKRGALERFPMAVKYLFVKCYYLMGMKTLLRYTKPSYEAFLHINFAYQLSQRMTTFFFFLNSGITCRTIDAASSSLKLIIH